MYITYFDEVKFQDGVQPYYWLAGIMVDAEQLWRLENQVAELSQEIFDTGVLLRETEFHAADIFHRKRNFKGFSDINDRITVLKRLITILNSEDGIGKIHVRIDPARMITTDYDEMAFVFFVERVEQLLRSRKAPGLLIGDRESDRVAGMFSDMLSRYRDDRTPYDFGIELRCLLDTVHYTHSHHSRMLQLADLFVWALQLTTVGDQEQFPRSEIVGHIRENTNLLSPTKYKHWPTAQSWIQVHL